MGKFAENLDLGKRVLSPCPVLKFYITVAEVTFFSCLKAEPNELTTKHSTIVTKTEDLI